MIRRRIGKLLFAFMAFTFLFKSALALNITYEVEPKEPVKDDTFSIIFTIEGDIKDDPYITFVPNGAEVLEKSDLGVSSRTSIINGRVSRAVSRQVRYELMANRAGRITLSDLVINIDGKDLKFDNVNVDALVAPKRGREIFLVAEISKQKVFLNEGIDVDYYLYSRTRTGEWQPLEFPKLENFIKRFHEVKTQGETVNLNGEVYRKELKYSARVYPDKIGTLYIDPMKIKILYEDKSNAGLGGFGFGFSVGRMKYKTLVSQKVKLEVLPLPGENVPKNFTGLVGKHDFSLKIARDKVLVNEPVEVTLKVEGPGALEKFGAPLIYSSDAIEDFDTKNSFEEINNQTAKKTFQYTLLARGNVKLPQTLKKFSYFDPDDETYKEVDLVVPQLTIEGTADINYENLKNELAEQKVEKNNETIVNRMISTGPLAPLFTESENLKLEPIDYILRILGLIIFIFLGESVFNSLRKGLGPGQINRLIKDIQKNGPKLSKLHRLFSELNSQNYPTLKDIIENSKLSEPSKTYFYEVVDFAEAQDYNFERDQKRIEFNKKHYDSVAELIKSEFDEKSKTNRRSRWAILSDDRQF